MKKLLALLTLICLPQLALADTCATSLMGPFTNYQAAKICGTFGAGYIGTQANNTYVVARNAANGANINIWKLDNSDNTVINSSASDELILQLEDDASRLISYTAASDAALAMKFGDAGTTATQIFTLSGSTSDADDDSSIRIAGGGAFGTDGTRGATIVIPGEEVSGGSDITYNAGASDTHIFQVAGTTELTIADDKLTFAGTSASIVPGATSLLFRNNADNATNITITDAGAVTTRAGITATTGDVTSTAGDLVASTSGKTVALQEATAGAKCMGSLTCNGASDVVTSTTCATTSSRIFLTRTSLDTDTTGDFYVKSISDGVSFTVACEASDTGTLNWIIFHEAA